MNIRMWCVLPVIVMLAGCATNDHEYVENTPPVPTAAPPERVSAVSDALAARMDSMLASQRLMAGPVTR